MKDSVEARSNDLSIAHEHASRAAIEYERFSRGIRTLYRKLSPHTLPITAGEQQFALENQAGLNLLVNPITEIRLSLRLTLKLQKTIATALRQEVLQQIEESCLGIISTCTLWARTFSSYHEAAFEASTRIVNVTNANLLGSQDLHEFINPKPNSYHLGFRGKTSEDFLRLVNLVPLINDCGQFQIRLKEELIATRCGKAPEFLSRSSGFEEDPIWDKDSGELRYQGVVARRFQVRSARVLVPILDRFQAEGWPTRLNLPASEFDRDRINDVRKQLNKNNSAIVFRRDGNGTGLTWEPKI